MCGHNGGNAGVPNAQHDKGHRLVRVITNLSPPVQATSSDATLRACNDAFCGWKGYYYRPGEEKNFNLASKDRI